ncbi:hypothetical protein NDU88_009360 [Pleurodeles waltl]|uniref:Uncharacterized protein n=1 Tax=Pleurodeles waltl TaxID=8319 RepID=A0AAV7PUP7_PLEWA|nr:hypothetical protein NDU88_009360 [Pleurodeles waltl]
MPIRGLPATQRSAQSMLMKTDPQSAQNSRHQPRTKNSTQPGADASPVPHPYSAGTRLQSRGGPRASAASAQGAARDQEKQHSCGCNGAPLSRAYISLQTGPPCCATLPLDNSTLLEGLVGVPQYFSNLRIKQMGLCAIIRSGAGVHEQGSECRRFVAALMGQGVLVRPLEEGGLVRLSDDLVAFLHF